MKQNDSIQTGKAMRVVIQQLVKDESGQVVGIGNSYVVEESDAKQLVASGDFKFENVPLGLAVVKQADGETVEDAEAIEADG